MVKFTVDQIREMMDRQEYIRNISVIAHVDHGKSTLTDSLIAKAGIIADSASGEKRFMDTLKEEQDRAITIKSTAVSLFFEHEEPCPPSTDDEGGGGDGDGSIRGIKKQPYLINLIDSPGHVDFSSEVTAALRVTDGALVVVDCVSGVAVQTETVLRQALAERIRPVLFVNKLDRIFSELNLSPEEAYCSFRNTIESINVIIATYSDESQGDMTIDPRKDMVGFGSGLHAWGFTLGTFAKLYAAKFGVSEKKMMTRLWGESYYDPESNKWVRTPLSASGKKLERGFCKLVLGPIKTLAMALKDGKVCVYQKMLKGLGLSIPNPQETGKALMKSVMRTWLPAGDALLDMIIKWLPSPLTAQKYRVENLYSGPMDDETASFIRTCDPNGPLVMYVAKMIPGVGNRMIAFGRIFSGTVRSGQTVRVCGPDYKPGSKRDLYIAKVQRPVLMMGGGSESIADCPCGNLIGIVGLEKYINKTATLTTDDNAHIIRTMKFSVSTCVKIAVEPVHGRDLPKLVEALKKLEQTDTLVQCSTSRTGEHLISGAGELHLEVCLNKLKGDLLKGVDIKSSDPVVPYSETVSRESSLICLAKSPNKLNRLWMKAEPLGQPLYEHMESHVGEIQYMEPKERARILAADFGWDRNEARKIWTFGNDEDTRYSCLVDCSKGVQYLNTIKDNLVGGFCNYAHAGVLTDEPLRAIRFNLMDVTIHMDPSRRGGAQILPTVRRAMYASVLSAGPRLMEPVYLCEILTPEICVGPVFSCLSQRRGEVVSQESTQPPLVRISAYLPVSESLGFASYLRQSTAGRAFPQLQFSHWQVVSGDPLEESSRAHGELLQIRARKGMTPILPSYTDYSDRL